MALVACLCWSTAITACEDEYSLEPTFCDDWCRTTLQAKCGDEPDNCIRECELTKSDEDCFALQRRLLSCYEAASKDAFSCLNIDFDTEVRVSSATCQTERDSLYECEAPGIGTCLDSCRAIQQQQLGSVTESGTGIIPYANLFEGDAGLPPGCPVLSEPCENSCWAMYAFTSAGLVSAGVDVVQPGPATSAMDAGAGEIGALACVQLALLQCVGDPGNVGPESAGSGDAGSGDAGSGESDVQAEGAQPFRTINAVIAECTGRTFDGD